MVFGPHLKARLADRYVRYAVSNQRVLIATQWWGRHLTSYGIRPEENVTLMQNGLDTVLMQAGKEYDSDGDLRPTLARLTGLADGAQVYQLIRQIQSTMDSDGAPQH